MLDLTIVKSKHGVFVNAYNHSSYYNNYAIDLDQYLFDGEAPQKTYRQGWYQIKDIPKKVEKLVNGKTTIVKYLLNLNITPNAVMPQEVEPDFFEDEDNYYLKEHYTAVKNQTESTKVAEEFKVNLYEQYDNFKPIKQEFEPVYDLVSTIVTPGKFWTEIPCKIGPEASFKYIREYIKKHIDGRFARLSSDYDFCLTVQKRIPLSEPEEFTYFSLGRTKRAKTIEKKGLRDTRDLAIFEMAPKPYQSYSLAPTFEADTTNELHDKIQTFCKDLMEQINEPVKDCPHCKGRGIILNKDKI